MILTEAIEDLCTCNNILGHEVLPRRATFLRQIEWLLPKRTGSDFKQVVRPSVSLAAGMTDALLNEQKMPVITVELKKVERREGLPQGREFVATRYGQRDNFSLSLLPCSRFSHFPALHARTPRCRNFLLFFHA